ncbi:hypothetical protein HPB48_002588 [Haemaphysalis longicornis]|uniref:Uncharacterized protein n=1 Tax=Haemaphysalis longicornis TaxID=44386 RepID=A0A9J6G0U9_HAELO|nr:hypothetical protein HPB48_002588 [Haemaphysalis longicornis]
MYLTKAIPWRHSLSTLAFPSLKFQFHGTNFEKLHEEISSEALPEEYGGKAPPLDFDAFWSQLEAAEPHFVTGNRFGYAVTEHDALPEDVKLPQESTAL